MLHLFFSFEGRLNRSMYWLAELVRLVVLVCLFGLLAAVSGESQEGIGSDQPPVPLQIVWWGAFAVWVYAGLALQAKRWHDRDKSGFWILVNFVPYVGGLIAFIECGCRRGTTGSNRFGPDSLGSVETSAIPARSAVTLPARDQVGAT